MQAQRRRRIYFIIFLLAGLGMTVGFSLYALRQNINLYLTPTQVAEQGIKTNFDFRVGGYVVPHSIHHASKSLQVDFQITDFHKKMLIQYNGILPALFKENQSIVAFGHLNFQAIFVATQVLAKHDATYKSNK